MHTPITYIADIGKQKPCSGRQPSCPFCHIDGLENILEQRGDILWLMNKFPVFKDTWPTVIIESKDHDGEITTYSTKKVREVIAFGLEKWLATEKNKDFRSVIYFRNYGPASGGSQHHPHSQIIGLRDYDYRDNILGENFLGTVFHEDENCYASLSDHPISGPAEINVTLKTDGDTSTFADTIQTSARYVLHDFPIPCDSYNLFFYHKKHIHVKIFPRYTTSPLYMGYRITQVFDEGSLKHMAKVLSSDVYFGGHK